MRLLHLLFCALAVSIACLPARAADIPRGGDGARLVSAARAIPTPDGIQADGFVEIGGIKQSITIRGADRNNPVLLILHGGPGLPSLPVGWWWQGPWEEYFVVVNWDQRGTGKTFGANPPEAMIPGMSIGAMVSDTEEVVAHLRQKLGRERIFVLGHSFGTVLGVELARRRPEWLHAYVGVSQVISNRQGDALGFDFAIKAARQHDNAEAMAALGPLALSLKSTGSFTKQEVAVQRRWVAHFGGLAYGRSSASYYRALSSLSPDYSASELLSTEEGANFTLHHLLDELMDVDLAEVDRLECPVFLFQGRNDWTVPSVLAERWLGEVTAPSKQIFWFKNSAHLLLPEEPGKVLLHLVQDVRPLAMGDRDPHLR